MGVYFIYFVWFFSTGWICTIAPEHLAATQVDAGNGMVVMTDRNSNAFFLSDSTWSKLSSVPLKHVSVGLAGVWGVDQDNTVYKFAAGDFFPTRGEFYVSAPDFTGWPWFKVFNCLVMLFVSSGLSLIEVDAGQRQVVGVTTQNSIHCLNASTASATEKEAVLKWYTIPGALMYFSCGPLGCWGVNSVQDIFFTVIFCLTSLVVTPDITLIH